MIPKDKNCCCMASHSNGMIRVVHAWYSNDMLRVVHALYTTGADHVSPTEYERVSHTSYYILDGSVI